MTFKQRFHDVLEDCRHLRVTHGSDVLSGDFGVFGSRFGVVREDAVAGQAFMILTRSSGKSRRRATGVRLDKDFSTFASGDVVYFDEFLGLVSSTNPGGRVPVGTASAKASTADDQVFTMLVEFQRPLVGSDLVAGVGASYSTWYQVSRDHTGPIVTLERALSGGSKAFSPGVAGTLIRSELDDFAAGEVLQPLIVHDQSGGGNDAPASGDSGRNSYVFDAKGRGFIQLSDANENYVAPNPISTGLSFSAYSVAGTRDEASLQAVWSYSDLASGYSYGTFSSPPPDRFITAFGGTSKSAGDFPGDGVVEAVAVSHDSTVPLTTLTANGIPQLVNDAAAPFVGPGLTSRFVIGGIFPNISIPNGPFYEVLFYGLANPLADFLLLHADQRRRFGV